MSISTAAGSPGAGGGVRGPGPRRAVAAIDGARLGEILETLGAVGAADALLGRYEQDLGDPRRMGEILIAQGRATASQVELALEIQRRAFVGPRRPAVARPVPSRAGRRASRDVVAGMLLALAAVAVALLTRHGAGAAGWYGWVALGLLVVKFIGSAVNRPVVGSDSERHRVAVVVCFYNEDPSTFVRCLESLLAQTRPVDEIWVVDDGSADDLCFRAAQEILGHRSGAVVHRFSENRGKRHAQGFAFAQTTSDLVVTIDSDTVLDPAAIEEGLKPFRDPSVAAVAANVRAMNHRRNLLTRLIDLRYANAFLFDRAAYSSVGSVVCCCGSLSFFRTEVVRRHLDDFLAQTFLGVPVQYGDDRRLTQYALLDGSVRLQETSVAYTLVPENLGHFRRQQLRWNKSFFRESLWAIRRFGPRRWPFWISVVELAVWFGYTVSLLRIVYLGPLMHGRPFSWHYVALAVVMAYARNVRYFGRPGDPPARQLATFACAPVYTLLHVVLLTPLRVWALLTLRRPGWGTRAKVEVRVGEF